MRRCSSTEQEITSVERAVAADVDKAVRAARAALSNPEWRDMCSLQRGQLIARLANMVSERKELFATIEAWDNGSFFFFFFFFFLLFPHPRRRRDNKQRKLTPVAQASPITMHSEAIYQKWCPL